MSSYTIPHTADFIDLQIQLYETPSGNLEREIFTGVTSQGKTIEEAVENIKEAVELYLEEMPEVIMTG